MKQNTIAKYSIVICRYVHIAFAAFAVPLLISCARHNASGAGMTRSAKLAEPRLMPTAKMQNMALERTDNIVFAEEAAMSAPAPDVQEGSMSAENSVASERKLIRSANISLCVSDLGIAEDGALAAVNKLGGYVAMSNRNDSALSIDIKVPASRFDEAVTGMEGMGKLIDKSINVTDVTDNYYDLDSRIRTKQILKERLESYLKASANMKDLVAVETQLNSVISDLESMQGQFKRLSNQIDYASLHIRFSLPTGKTERGLKWPSVSLKVRAFIVGAAGFFSTLFLTVLGIVLFGTPIVLLAAVFYYLTFGKLGLIKKLFKRMKDGAR